MDEHIWVHRVSAKRFVNRCKEEFNWTDLSEDVIMDVGCGLDGFIGKRLLEMFKKVGTIIGITKDPNVANNLREGNTTNIQYVIADIEDRKTLQDYEGKMTKVISTHYFQYVAEWEEAARNVYHLLKPGGEAAVLFVVKSSLYEWLTEMLKEPRWKDYYQGHYVENLYKDEFGAAEREKVLKIGFEEVQCLEQSRLLPYQSDQSCKVDLFEIFGKSFNIPPELLDEFKEQSFQVLLKINGRDNEGKSCLRLTEVTWLLKKPTEGSGSETKDNIAS